MFIYNQSQNPSSGNRGIACIALTVIKQSETNSSLKVIFEELFQKQNFKDIISVKKLTDEGKGLVLILYF